jgi:hypothetical protein
VQTVGTVDPSTAKLVGYPGEVVQTVGTVDPSLANPVANPGKVVHTVRTVYPSLVDLCTFYPPVGSPECVRQVDVG